jgi:hypothetical protein
MEQIEILVKNPEAAPLDAIETDEFKLELLDCGPAYKIQDTGTTCLSCVCGNCLCGTAAEPD